MILGYISATSGAEKVVFRVGRVAKSGNKAITKSSASEADIGRTLHAARSRERAFRVRAVAIFRDMKIMRNSNRTGHKKYLSDKSYD